mgnify:CR=1 FL=1
MRIMNYQAACRSTAVLVSTAARVRVQLGLGLGTNLDTQRGARGIAGVEGQAELTVPHEPRRRVLEAYPTLDQRWHRSLISTELVDEVSGDGTGWSGQTLERPAKQMRSPIKISQQE